jgi:GrpB-like predicted nucleotidyltransferase (UPF0157 family)
MIELSPYDPTWPSLFAAQASQLREVLGSLAVRIDHIGSTAVPGLMAKPIIDIQISVSSLEPMERYQRPLEGVGLIYRADNPERTKRYFREAAGQRRTHIHVRRVGSWAEQFALLFRDFLRESPNERDLYAQTKQSLAEKFRYDRAGYSNAKAPILWEIMGRADRWSQATGWEPGCSDG